MRPKKAICGLKPDIAILGYALFLAINAASVWGGVFPFLPMGFQTRGVMTCFFLAQAVSFTFVFFASAYLAQRRKMALTPSLLALAVGACIGGWALLIIGLYVDVAVGPLATMSGCALGLGSALFYMLWQRLFSSMDSDRGSKSLILGTAYASIIYFLLYLIPKAVTSFLIPLVFLPLFALALVLKSRDIDLSHPMFDDDPTEHRREYGRAFHGVIRSALCIGSLGFCTGIIRALAIEEPTVGTLVNILSMATALVAAGALWRIWQHANLRISVVSMYSVFFPFVTTAFLLLPFLGTGYARILAAALYALYSVVIMLMMIQCAQISRDRGMNPLFIYGVFGFIVYALHALGFILGTSADLFAGTVATMDLTPLSVTALVALFVLALLHFFGLDRFKGLYEPNPADESVELLALAAKPAARLSPRATAKDGGTNEGMPGASVREGASADNAHTFRDRLSKQVDLVRRQYRLSSREAEVMELVARGNSVPRIAETLVVSENTIRTHTRRIYAKLDVHKKQDLIDLVNAFDPKDAEAQAAR